MSFFNAIIENSFLQNALYAIFLIGIISGAIGSLLVSNKIVFLGGGVAHCAYGGIGAAIFFGFSTLLGASLSSIFVAFILSYVRKKYEDYIDTFSAILWALGMSLGVIFINLSTQNNADIESYLFGSIISVSNSLLSIMCAYNACLLFFICIYYKEILSISYDYEFCKLCGLKVDIFVNVIFLFIAIGVVLSMQISGLILVLAMLSIPAYISSLFVRTLGGQMLLSSILSVLFMLCGLYFAFSYNVSSGACITIISVIFMLVAMGLKFILRR